MGEYTYDTSWTNWNDTSTCSICGATDTWRLWIDNSTATTFSTSNDIWDAWVSYEETTTGGVTYKLYYQQPQETAEVRQQRIEQEQQRERERQAAYAAELKQREEAVAKAERLLMESLREKQLEEYQEFKRFTVISKDGKRTYRVNKGRIRNVQLIDQGGKVLRTYCGHPQEYVPDEDTMLAQKLLLEHEEERFLKLANVS